MRAVLFKVKVEKKLQMSAKRTMTIFVMVLSLVLIGCGQSQDTHDNKTTAQSGSVVLDVSHAGQNAVSEQEAGKKTVMSEDGRLNLLVLVNKTHKLPEGWEGKLDLVKVENSKGETVEIDTIAAEAFKELQQDLRRSEGITVELNSGYRSVSEQKRIWDEFLVEYGEDYVLEYVAKPGYSEHHTGLALDAYLVVDGAPVLTNDEIFSYQDTWDTIHSYLAKHGFILRYPYGMEDVTGYTYEPWHFRYVGKEAAKAIMSKDLTLEEYLIQE